MKVKFGAIVTDGRNKVGGHVFSKNRAGSYMRTKVTPVNPQTPDQLLQRSNLSGLATAWRGLTESQRDTWNQAVDQWKTTDIFGDITTPSGFNLYVRLNRNLFLIGLPRLDEAPAPSSVAEVVIVAFSANTTTGTITLTTTGAVAGTSYVILMTAPQSAGKSFVSSELRIITFTDSTGIASIELSTEWEAKFGSFGVADLGLKLFIRVLPVVEANGQAGTGVRESAIVTI